MLKLICPLLLIFIFSACSKHEDKIKFPDKSEIVGLAMPVTLKDTITSILTNDFFLDESIVDSVSTSNGFNAELSTDKKIIKVKSENRKAYLGILKCFTKGFEYDIILKASPKVLVKLSFDAKGKDVKQVLLKSEINNWNENNNPFIKNGSIWECELLLNPGTYQYLIVVDGKAILDPIGKDSVDNNIGGFNSLLKVGQDDRASLPQLHTSSFTENTITLSSINNPDSIFVLYENYRINSSIKENQITFTIPTQSKSIDRTHIRVWSYNNLGSSNDILIPLQKGKVIVNTKELSRMDKQKTIMYFMMVDRFKDGDTTNDKPLKDPRVDFKADYQGGDLAGITQKIKDGYFSKLGINCIWISPITQNPLTAYQEYPSPRRWFSGYHGYWPVSFTKIDFRFGDDSDLTALVDEAHKNNMNVILDFVSNHVHEENPMYKNHPEYFTSVDLPDGRKNIRIWDEYRLTTWFDTFMPDIDYSKPEVVNLMVDSAVYWIKKYKLDGFRHDATKHVPEVFWQALTKKLKQEIIIGEGRDVIQIGETFGSRELIASYLSSGMMEAKFDFNLYFDMRSVLANDVSSFNTFTSSMNSSFHYFGWHSLMGNITGNHDITRFISLASRAMTSSENDKEAGWSRKIEVKDTIGYNRLKLLHTFIMTLPGIPVVYAGDDIGDPGANDPDNRRMMRFEKLKPQEESVKSNLEKLTSLRSSSMALLYGDYDLLSSTDSTLVYARSYFDDFKIVVMNKSRNSSSVSFKLPSYINDKKLTSLYSNILKDDNGNISLELKPSSADILF